MKINRHNVCLLTSLVRLFGRNSAVGKSRRRRFVVLPAGGDERIHLSVTSWQTARESQCKSSPNPGLRPSVRSFIRLSVCLFTCPSLRLPPVTLLTQPPDVSRITNFVPSTSLLQLILSHQRHYIFFVLFINTITTFPLFFIKP